MAKKKKKRSSTPPVNAARIAQVRRNEQELLQQDRQHIEQPKPQQSQSPSPIKILPRPLKYWLTGWRLLLELMTVAGLAIAVFALRPVLSVTSLALSDLHQNGGSKASITVTGTGIRDVAVGCATNKVIFDDKNTLAFTRYALIDEYSVKDVAAGESFTADCNFIWSLWTRPTDGFVLMGAGSSGIPQLGIRFGLKDGDLVPNPRIEGAAFITPHLEDYASSQVTAIDGEFIVLYKWPWSWFQQQRHIRMIARRNNGELKWRVAPNSEPTIPNGNGGYIIAAKGPTNSAEWSLIMTRTAPPH